MSEQRTSKAQTAIVHESDGTLRPWCGASLNRGDSVVRRPAEVTCAACIAQREPRSASAPNIYDQAPLTDDQLDTLVSTSLSIPIDREMNGRLQYPSGWVAKAAVQLRAIRQERGWYHEANRDWKKKCEDLEAELASLRSASARFSSAPSEDRVAGAAQERATIVAWLRAYADEAERIPGPEQYEDALRNAAESIELGEHEASAPGSSEARTDEQTTNDDLNDHAVEREQRSADALPRVCTLEEADRLDAAFRACVRGGQIGTLIRVANAIKAAAFDDGVEHGLAMDPGRTEAPIMAYCNGCDAMRPAGAYCDECMLSAERERAEAAAEPEIDLGAIPDVRAAAEAGNELGLLRQLAWRVGEWLDGHEPPWPREDEGEVLDAYRAWRAWDERSRESASDEERKR